MLTVLVITSLAALIAAFAVILRSVGSTPVDVAGTIERPIRTHEAVWTVVAVAVLALALIAAAVNSNV
jgi:hypothetical protein